MVERATGRVIDLPGEPHWSPDGLRFVSPSVCGDRCSNRVDVWSLRDGAAKLEWRQRIKQGEKTHFYGVEGWRGLEQVQLRITPETECDCDSGKDLIEAEAVDAMLTRVGPGWVLDSPLVR